jgi:hypothetical protein
MARAPLDEVIDRLLVRFGCEILASMCRGGCPPKWMRA